VKRLLDFISENLLCAVTLAFTVGISCSLRQNDLSWQITFFVVIGILTLLLFWFQRKATAIVMILIFYAVLGNLYGCLRGKAPASQSDISYLIQKKSEAVLIGTLQSVQGFNGETSKAVMTCRFIRFKKSDDFTSTAGRILLTLKASWPVSVKPGNRILVRAILSRPHSLQTAGTFDYKTYLEEKDIRVTGFIPSSLFVHVIASRNSLGNTIHYAAQRARVRIGSAIDRTLTPELAGLYKAILIGDRSGINQDVIEHYKGSGCMHILSISGMHMSIIGVFLFAVFYWLLRRSSWLILHFDTKKIAAAACIPFLVFYALLAGSNIPVIRSLIMSAIVVLALCTGRQRSIFATLSLAVFLILAWSPESLFTASFQLTFAAVASIVAIFPKLMQHLTALDPEEKQPQSFLARLKNWVFAALMISTSATIGTAPLLLYYFNRLSLVGPFANLAAEPLICFWSLPLGFLACPFIFISPSFAAILLNIGSWGIIGANKIVKFFYPLPLESVWLPTPSPLLIVSYYLSLFLLFFAPISKIKLRLLTCSALMITLLFIRFPPYEIFKHFYKDSTITVIDVGQGSANLIEFPAGKRALIDGGGPSSPKFNTGEAVIGPFLWRKGITTIDSVIITHPDADHYNGLPFIVKHFHPTTLWINGSPGHDPDYTKLLRLAKKLQVTVRVPEKKDLLLSGGNSTLIAIPNPLTTDNGKNSRNKFYENARISSNDAGLIIKFTDHNFSALFPGDISKRVEQRLIKQPKRLLADVLLSPHHGSATSNSTGFLKAVHPALLLVSAGYRKRGIFPARNLKERTYRLGIKMMTTAFSGCVVITSNGRKFSVAAGDGISGVTQITTGIIARSGSSIRNRLQQKAIPIVVYPPGSRHLSPDPQITPL